METQHMLVSFGPIDCLNIGFGYSVRIEYADKAETIFFGDKDPQTGKDLLTPADCLRVISYFVV